MEALFLWLQGVDIPDITKDHGIWTLIVAHILLWERQRRLTKDVESINVKIDKLQDYQTKHTVSRK